MASHEVWRPWWTRCGPRPCPWPSMDRSPLCGEVRVCVWAATGLPLSAWCALILASACVHPSLANWGDRLSPWARAHHPQSQACPGSHTSGCPSEAPRVSIWKLSTPLLPRLFSLSPPLLPLPLSLSLLLPNASWLCLNISPPRFLAPALGAFTKRRRASSLPPCPPCCLPPPEEPL